MLTHLTILLAGYSIFSAASLLFAYWFFLPDLQKGLYSKVSCAALLAGISGLQWCHYPGCACRPTSRFIISKA